MSSFNLLSTLDSISRIEVITFNQENRAPSLREQTFLSLLSKRANICLGAGKGFSYNVRQVDEPNPNESGFIKEIIADFRYQNNLTLDRARADITYITEELSDIAGNAWVRPRYNGFDVISWNTKIDEATLKVIDGAVRVAVPYLFFDPLGSKTTSALFAFSGMDPDRIYIASKYPYRMETARGEISDLFYSKKPPATEIIQISHEKPSGNFYVVGLPRFTPALASLSYNLSRQDVVPAKRVNNPYQLSRSEKPIHTLSKAFYKNEKG